MGRATTVLVVLSGDDAETSEAGRALRERVNERDDLESASVARLASLAAEARDEDDESAVLEAERRIEAAEQAFSTFDYSGATTALGEALELLRPTARRATGRRRIAELHLQLAMILQVHGEEGAALEELRTCLHVDAGCEPDPARHPPNLVALHTRARETDTQTATLQITTTPAGARLVLDGRREATSPATFEDVPVGRHYLTMERDGFLPEVTVVSVAAGEGTTRELALTEGPPSARAAAALRALQARGAEADTLWRREAATLTEADTLLVLRLDEGLALAAFDGRGSVLGERTHDSDDGGVARSFLDETLPPPSVPFYGQWWFWTPIALALSVGLALATFFTFATRDVQLLGGGVMYE